MKDKQDKQIHSLTLRSQEPVSSLSQLRARDASDLYGAPLSERGLQRCEDPTVGKRASSLGPCHQTL